MTDGSRRAIVAAFLANLGIAVAKLVAFFFTGAASMLAESVHSLADTGNQALLLLVSISVVPTGGLTVAVLLSEPVAVGLTVPVTRYVTLLPTGRLTS